MKLFETNGKIKLTLFTKFVLFLLVIFLFQAVMNYWFIRHNEFADARSKLFQLNSRVQDDLKYSNGVWDVDEYNHDQLTPNPTGSGGFTTTLYIVSKDGLVIERNLPIHGLLDTTDYKSLLTYEKPQTLSTATGEQWRVFTLPLYKGDSLSGAVFTSYHSPSIDDFSQIDQSLKAAAETISGKITYNESDINTKSVDIREVDYRISFEVINDKNQVVINNGRIPSAMDTRYFYSEITASSPRIIIDDVTKEPFLVTHKIIKDEKEAPVGVVVSAQSILTTETLLKKYILFTITTSAGLIAIISLSIFYTFRHELAQIVERRLHHHHLQVGPQSISFSPSDGKLSLDTFSFTFPKDTNQFQLLKEVFVKPGKAIHEDRLLKLIGKDLNKENWRVIYNSLLAVNKKTGVKLILYQDRSYRLNPEFLQLIN